ncbi:MAG TPA: xanthine dehydrogenase family protein subunit M [Nocardioidaceae bacterium]|nr:xanthine dehydrogenase family protein subunit M [Nocardioidaceae bacterium]
MSVQRFVEPQTVADAWRDLAEDPWGAKVIAGGTAVVLMMRQRLLAPSSLVSIRGIPALRGIATADGVVRIGATTTLSEVASSPEVRRHAPSVARACALVGNPRVRNAATLGGNLAEADYASDPPAALAAVGARCTIVGPDGQRTVPVAELITGFYETVLAPAELVESIELPAPAGERREVYLKYRSRSSEDRACVGVAARIDLDRGRVADADVVVGAVASTLQRAPEALAELRGRRLDAEAAGSVARAYAAAIEPMHDGRGSASYRRKMIQVFVRRALLQITDEAGGEDA